MRKLSVVLAIAAAAALLMVSIGGGAAIANRHHHVHKVRTRLTIHFRQSTYSASFFGKVKSHKSFCRRHRKVVVIRKPSHRIGHTKSNRRGHWSLKVGGTPKHGRYLAKSRRKRVRRHHKRYICKAGKSRTITVG